MTYKEKAFYGSSPPCSACRMCAWVVRVGRCSHAKKKTHTCKSSRAHAHTHTHPRTIVRTPHSIHICIHTSTRTYTNSLSLTHTHTHAGAGAEEGGVFEWQFGFSLLLGPVSVRCGPVGILLIYMEYVYSKGDVATWVRDQEKKSILSPSVYWMAREEGSIACIVSNWVSKKKSAPTSYRYWTNEMVNSSKGILRGGLSFMPLETAETCQEGNQSGGRVSWDQLALW